MPRMCSVFGCRSNYRGEKERFNTFSLPTDPEIRRKWLRAIPTDLSKVKNPNICIKHFKENEIIRTDKVIYKGELKEYQRDRPKLVETAVPSLFENVPSYLSKTNVKSNRLADVEEARFEQAVKDSLADHAAYVESKKLSNLSDIEQALMQLQDYKKKWTFIVDSEKLSICFINFNFNEPFASAFVVIYENLTFDIFIDNIKLSKLNNILKFKCINSVNVLEELFDFIKAKNTKIISKSHLETAVDIIKSVPSYDESDSLKFIVEQICLSQQNKYSRRYTNQTMILASCLYIYSPSAYKAVLKCGFLFFPHPRNIQKLIFNYQLDCSLENSKYSIKHLKSHELLVNLLMDEIYIQPQFSIKGGQIYGSSFSDPSKAAKTAQVFMVSSIFSKHREVVAIVPVCNLQSEQLKNMLASLISNLETAGYTIISIISDNNAVNKKTFELFSPQKILQPYVPHPLDNSRNLFLIFDTVHILKSIRNNWETRKNENKTLRYPDIKNNTSVLAAQFNHLKIMHEREKESLVKYGHTLSIKSLYPSNIQKQNVNLALKVFNENNIVALKHISKDYPSDFIDYEGTTNFIEIIVKWWKIVNVKSAFEGIRFNDEYRHPFRKTSDMQMQFLKEFSLWLKNWRCMIPMTHSLSAQTFQSLIQTTDAFVKLIHYLFEKYNCDYILLSKFQTDNLESRFSSYRQLSGANYFISYIQVLENERKIKFKNAVLFSSRNKEIPLRTLIPFEEKLNNSVCIDSISGVLDINFDFDEIPENVKPILIYIGGYAAMKILKHKHCLECKSWLQINKEVIVDPSYDFIKDLDRGKLTLPTEWVVCAVSVVWYLIYNISNNYEEVFFKFGTTSFSFI